jgi:hypothetical protein
MPEIPIFAPLKISRVGQGVKTPPFHGGITGSNPVRGTKSSCFGRIFYLPPPVSHTMHRESPYLYL